MPHYRRAFDAAGVHPGDCRDLADLAKFPTTSKADLRENYPFGMFAVPQDQVRRIHASSGTTGQPTVVGYTAGDIDAWAGLMARSLRAAGARPGRKGRDTVSSPVLDFSRLRIAIRELHLRQRSAVEYLHRDAPGGRRGLRPIASLFKQFELIYVVGNERDLVRVRTNYRKETVYLYRLNSPVENVRKLLLVYLERINELADRPEFYHLLTNSCTINIIRYANAAGRTGQFNIRHLLNGLIDSYLYHSGRVDTTLPFEELRRRSLINDVAQAADDAPDFSDRIRASLPTTR